MDKSQEQRSKGKVFALLAEDHPDTREAIEFTLRTSGIEVTSAENGLIALRLLAQFKFDLLITDLMMPEMSGIELIKVVRDAVAWKKLPIIVLSAFSNVYLMEAHRAGATVVLRKPDDLDKLVETVIDLLLKKEVKAF